MPTEAGQSQLPNTPSPSTLDRFLRLFTEVRAGEGTTALVMFANVYLILCAYYFIKPLREGWIAISGVGSLSKMEVKAYSSFAQGLLLLIVVAGYGRLVDRYSRSALISRATIFCMIVMVIFWCLQPEIFMYNLPATGIVFYLWVGMFGVFVVAQFWAFAADLYSHEQGHRLIPLVAIGATAGAASGSWLTTLIVDSGLFGTESLLLVALVPLTASIFLTRIADARGPAGDGSVTTESSSPANANRRGALNLILSSRFLLAVAAITLLLNWVNSNGENLLFRVVQQFLESEAVKEGITAPNAILEYTRAGTTAFYGDFFFWVNICALFLQALVASRLLRYGGFGATLLMLPAIALMSYTVMALIPILSIVKLMKIAENSTDYSINNTAKSVLWLPATAEMKYKGKPSIDSLFARIGDGMAALTVLVGVQVLSLETSTFFAFSAALVVVWIVVALWLVREHGRMASP
jgi:AAA family ATP:ADP antiporter